MDWKNGTYYKTFTVGVFEVGGTPNGVAVEGYVGTTSLHGMPLFWKKDITDYIEGYNIDTAVSVGGDAIGKASATKGLSVDLGDDHRPVHTGAGWLGYQYAIENSIEGGFNLVPNGVDVSIEGGGSYTWVTQKYDIPWWPR
jgi:hypothetical protein